MVLPLGEVTTRLDQFQAEQKRLQKELSLLRWRKLAASDRTAGRLAIPFDVPLPMHLGFFLVSSPVSSSRPKVAAFRDWLLAEMGDD